jgi:hypothetical protein
MTTGSVLRFPHRCIAAVFVCEDDAGWLVLGPRGHGWTHGDRHSATTDAEWLARNLGLPIRSTDGTQ